MEYSGFFNGNHSYGEEEFNRYFANIYESGVSVDENNKMTMNVFQEGKSIAVNPGFAIIKGYYLYVDKKKLFNIEKPLSGTHYYRMVITLIPSIGNSSISLRLKNGTDKLAPALDGEGNELSLASIKIDSAGNITIIDERFNEELCGTIRPKNVTSYKTMIQGLQHEFNVWMAGMQNKMRDVFIQDTKPNESVCGSVWIDTSGR